MPAKLNKAVVTNVSALKAKYGNDGWRQLKTALDGLIEADGKRGLTTALVALDHDATMARFEGKPVTRVDEPRQSKAAIDAVYRALVPDYVMILGAVDVVPHQDLENPASQDGDPCAYGDLPYACEKAYSQKVEDFTAITRAVGRLPDVTGATDPAYLIGLLQVATGYTPRPASDYSRYLGLTAAVWQGSTALSLKAIFGSADALQLIPPNGPRWPADSLAARAHFINCHGAPADFHYYGQSGSQFPVAHDAMLLASTPLSEGTVIAAECCYGAELYNPKIAQNQLGMVNTYLASKAYGFFGSSTTAYGPSDGNESADLLCQYFMKHVLTGASLGRAVLQARQEFVAHSPVLNPIDLKTIGQFSLMGDPSIQPVQAPQGFTVLQKGMAMAADLSGGFGRGLRRESLRSTGFALGSAATSVDSDSRRKTPPRVQALMQAEVEKALAELSAPRELASETQFSSFNVRPPRPAPGTAHLAKALPRAAPVSVHLAVVDASPAVTGEGSSAMPGRQLVAVVALERGGTFATRRLFSR